MKDISSTKSSKSHSENSMSSTALIEARGWYDKLMDVEHHGRKDKNGSARGRLADDMGVNEHKLVRLEYYFDDMRDVSGELYRRLRIWYLAKCEGNEEAAAAMRAERLKLRTKRNAAFGGPVQQGQGKGSALD